MLTFSPMDAARAKNPATYEDLLALPENLVGEIVDGELYASPRPASPHALAASRLGALEFLLRGGNGDQSGWLTLDEPELHIGGHVMVSDLAAWRRERMPTMPDVPFFELAPDWVCEVISPSTGRLDRLKKMPRYGQLGLHHLWIVDPIAKVLEVYRSEGPHWIVVGIHGDGDKVRAEPFEAIELDLSMLWAR